jgi:hypothetical protein
LRGEIREPFSHGSTTNLRPLRSAFASQRRWFSKAPVRRGAWRCCRQARRLLHDDFVMAAGANRSDGGQRFAEELPSRQLPVRWSQSRGSRGDEALTFRRRDA